MNVLLAPQVLISVVASANVTLVTLVIFISKVMLSIELVQSLVPFPVSVHLALYAHYPSSSLGILHVP
jgi:hypothetical protein